MLDFEDKVVVVTGAAGSLGQVAARMFLQRKARLVLVDRAQDRLQAEFPELVDNPSHFLATGVDLTDADDVKGMVNEAVARLQQIDILLNLAGMYRGGIAVRDTELETWQSLIAVNAQSVLLTCREIAPLMIQQHSGKIINVAARPGLKAGSGNAAYAASKSAVLRLTESLSSELKEAGIHVNAIIPGTIDTPDNRQSMPSSDFDRWVEPEALVEVIMFLASDAARAIHGAAIPAYGLS